MMAERKSYIIPDINQVVNAECNKMILALSISQRKGLCCNSSESFLRELEESFGEDFNKVKGTILDNDEEDKEKERMIEREESLCLYRKMVEEINDDEIDDDFWEELEEFEDEYEVDVTDSEILESFIEETSDEMLHNGHYSKTSPYSELDDCMDNLLFR